MTVRWEKVALAALAGAWLAADSEERQRIVEAAAEIDRRLTTDPGNSGESRPGHRRIMFVGPLGVLFGIAEDTVSILRVWRLRRRT